MNQDLHAGSLFRVIPVLDLRGGRAVQAKKGNRSAYLGLKSRLCSGNDPVDAALAFRDVLGLESLYVADLDAIELEQPNLTSLHRLARLGLDLWVDLGLRRLSQLRDLPPSDSLRTILATETLPGMGLVQETIRHLGWEPRGAGTRPQGRPPDPLRDMVRGAIRRPLDDHPGRSRRWGPSAPYAGYRSRRDGARACVTGACGDGPNPLPRVRDHRGRRRDRSTHDLEDGKETRVPQPSWSGSALHDGRIGPEDVRAIVGPITASPQQRHSATAD